MIYFITFHYSERAIASLGRTTDEVVCHDLGGYRLPLRMGDLRQAS